MKRTLILTMGLIAMMVAVGCARLNPAGPNDLPGSAKAAQEQTQVGVPLANRLVGAWKMKDGENSIVFAIEGKVEVTSVIGGAPPLTASGVYRVTEYKIVLEINPIERDKDNAFMFTTYAYTLEGDTMTLTGPDGKVTVWKKA